MEDKTQLPEYIQELLKEISIKHDKPLDDVIADYKKFIQGNEKELSILYSLWELAKLRGQDPYEVLQEAFKSCGIKKPDYKKATALYDYGNIKKDDTLIFNMDYTELDDGDIYLFSSKVLNKKFSLYGEYNKEIDGFILGVEKTILKNNSDIEVLGVLTKVERDL